MSFFIFEGKLFKANPDGTTHAYLHPFKYWIIVIFAAVWSIFFGALLLYYSVVAVTWNKDVCEAQQGEQGRYTVVCKDSNDKMLRSDSSYKDGHFEAAFPINVFWKQTGLGAIDIYQVNRVYASIPLTILLVVMGAYFLFWLLNDLHTLPISKYQNVIKSAMLIKQDLVDKAYAMDREVRGKQNGRPLLFRDRVLKVLKYLIVCVVLVFSLGNLFSEISLIRNSQVTLCRISDVQRIAASRYVVYGRCGSGESEILFTTKINRNRKLNLFSINIEDIGKQKEFFIQKLDTGVVIAKLKMSSYESFFGSLFLLVICGYHIHVAAAGLKKYF